MIALGRNLMKPTAMLYRNPTHAAKEPIRADPSDAVDLLSGYDMTPDDCSAISRAQLRLCPLSGMLLFGSVMSGRSV